MLKISILLALVFYGVISLARKAFQEYNWKEYTMKDEEYNERKGKDREREENSRNRF